MRKGWTTVAALTFACSRKDGYKLAVFVSPLPNAFDRWSLQFIEMPDASSVQNVLDNHAHSKSREVQGLLNAMKLAELRAKAWQKKSTAAKPCPCEEIDP